MFPVEELTSWMDARGLGRGPLVDVETLAGGTQNILVRFRRGDDVYVFRRPPMAKRANSDETMRREARVLAALHGSGVPHPELIAAESDIDVIGAAFYLMQPIDGVTIGAGFAGIDDGADVSARLGLAMTDGLIALAAVDHVAVGLADFGKPGSYLDRQVARWRSQLEGYAEVESYPGPGVDVEQIGEWLEANRPGTEHVGILHGDFHLGNVIFAPDGSLAAIVDWELATIGDPLLDFAQLLVTWPDPGSGLSLVGSMPPPLSQGLTRAPEMITRYEAGTGWDLADLAWYRVLAGYRLGIILEGTRVRAGAGQAPPEIGDMLHHTAVNLWEQARRTIATA
jgi:aminoglycoside phosphotransferase (APT) family kinase protein